VKLISQYLCGAIAYENDQLTTVCGNYRYRGNCRIFYWNLELYARNTTGK